MSFQDAVRVCLRKYADFSGRARRSEYWWFVVFNAVVTTIASVIDAIIGTRFGSTGLIQVLATLALLLPGLAVAVRRLHDVGRPGWWLFLVLIPIVGALILIIAFLVRDSEPDNTYGPSPKANQRLPDPAGSRLPAGTGQRFSSPRRWWCPRRDRCARRSRRAARTARRMESRSVLVAERTAGRARAALEQRVAGEDAAGSCDVEADRAGRVARRVQHRAPRRRPRGLAVLEVDVPEVVGVGQLPQRPVVGVQQDRRTDRSRSAGATPDVVVVGVGADDRLHLRPPTTARIASRRAARR